MWPPAMSWMKKAPVSTVLSVINQSSWSYAHQLCDVVNGRPHFVLGGSSWLVRKSPTQ